MNKISDKKIAETIKVHRNTWTNWKKSKPDLVKYVQLGLEFEELKKNGGITIGEIKGNAIVGNHNQVVINGSDICSELCNELSSLNEKDKKELYHKFMGMILEKKN